MLRAFCEKKWQKDLVKNILRYMLHRLDFRAQEYLSHQQIENTLLVWIYTTPEK
jgi:hypothetical protein